MKKILIRRLSKFFGINKLVDEVKQQAIRINFLETKLKEQQDLLLATRKLIHVGVDVDLHNRKHDVSSWCVVCVHKQEKEEVYFYDLPAAYMIQLNEQLKKFKGTNVTLDVPRNMRRFFDL